MEIQNCSLSDLQVILSLYDFARNLQIQRKMVVWPQFEKQYIEKEILDNCQWKLIIDKKVACNWAITFNDKEIWGEKDKGDSIFIHRICTNQNMRGNRYIDKIVEWAFNYSKKVDKQYIRLDTLGNNTRLIKHYTSAGFEFLGMVKLTDTANLPLHYQKEPNCCLFEINTHKSNISNMLIEDKI